MRTTMIIVATAAAFILATTSITNAIDNALSRTRNQYLRLYISYKKRKIVNCTSIVIEKMNKTYNMVLSKYYDAHIFYYSLSEKERELFDQIINSSY